jgi:hypothetical protein
MHQCEQEPITQSKISKLADFYIVYDHLFGQREMRQYSRTKSVENTTATSSDTEFLAAVNNKDINKAMKILDELMETIKTLHPRMYDHIIEKLNDI